MSPGAGKAERCGVGWKGRAPDVESTQHPIPALLLLSFPDLYCLGGGGRQWRGAREVCGNFSIPGATWALGAQVGAQSLRAEVLSSWEPSPAIAGQSWEVIRAWAWAWAGDERAVLAGVVAAQVQPWGQLLVSLRRSTLRAAAFSSAPPLQSFQGGQTGVGKPRCKGLRGQGAGPESDTCVCRAKGAKEISSGRTPEHRDWRAA